jgi:Ca2+-binding RTX toxin-like protein
MAAWSPDGSRLAFIAGRDGDFELYAMNADGSGQARLTDHPGSEFSPAWSPDGTRITYNSFADGNFEIFAIDSDGTDAGNLTNHFAFDSRPDWQPLLSTEAPGIAVAGGSCGPADRTAAVDLMLTDADTSIDDLTVELASDNTVLLPPDALALTGAGASRRLALAPARAGTGTGVVTVTVSDGFSETSLAVTVNTGGPRGDLLAGTSGPDVMLGQRGDDEVLGRGGDDLLCGGRGRDVLTGGTGADHFSGGKGADVATDLDPVEGDSTDGTVE